MTGEQKVDAQFFGGDRQCGASPVMKVSISSAARVLPRRSSTAVIGEQRTASEDLGKQKLYQEKQASSAGIRRLGYFKNRFMLSRSMIP
jgi:hypothetical protein